MKAIVQRSYGPPLSALTLQDAPDPVPAPDEALVRVQAASVNAADWHLVCGEPRVMRLAGLGLRRPRADVPGSDLAGAVAAIGADVSGLAVGDRVVGWGRGAFAELAAVPADQVVGIPDGLDATHAATIPMAGMTALQGLRDVGRLVAGQRVLITGASGGVGTFAVQIAASTGAHVTATCSTRNLAMVRSLGADQVLDYTRDAVPGPGPYDVILHVAGPTSLRALRGALTRHGTLVLTTGEGGRWFGPLPTIACARALSPLVPQRLTMLIAKQTRADLLTLVRMAGAGTVTPVVDRTVALADVPAAVEHLRAGHTRGKVVVVP